MIKGIAAINVYKKVAIVRRSSDTVTYEDSDGNIKTVKDLGEVASAAVSRARLRLTMYMHLLFWHFLTHVFES